MTSEDVLRQLHDRATRGEELSSEEQAQLENWYALQDSAETQALGLAPDEDRLGALQAQVEAALTELMAVTRRSQETSSENEALRREIIALRRQLVSSTTLQPA
jgi:hypothetical protein